MRMKMPLPLLSFCAAVLLAVAGAGHAISYTVQVVAVSDQAQALSLVRQLLLDDFPAYATRTTTEQGDVYRVRVGGFANRAAALLFAEAMPDLPALGGPPLPTLAENIPPGVTPLEPRLLLQAPAGATVEILDWLPEPALRIPAAAGEPDTFHLFSGDTSVIVEGWGLWQSDVSSALRLRELPLWPETWRDDPAGVRAAQLDSLVGFLSERFQLPKVEVEAAAVRPEEGRPYLVVLERFDPWQDGETGSLLAVALRPAGLLDGSSLGLAGEVPPLPEPVVLFSAEPETVQVQRELTGSGWTLRSDGEFMLQLLSGADHAWRVAVGSPVWTDGNHLLVRTGQQLLYYDFVER